ncbi:hypothetical protein [Nostoc sp.]
MEGRQERQSLGSRLMTAGIRPGTGLLSTSLGNQNRIWRSLFECIVIVGG